MDLDKFEIDDKAKGEIQAAIDAEIAGLKNKKEELLGKIVNYKKELDKFDGLDIDALKRLAAKDQQSKEHDMIKAGQINELITSKIQDTEKKYQQMLKAEQGKAEEASKALESERKRINEMTVNQKIRDMASKVSDLFPSAVDDVVLRASSTWDTKDGTLIPKNGESLEPEKWLEGFRETHPHYFGKASGVNAKGGNADNNSGKIMPMSKFVELQPQEQADLMKKGYSLSDD